MYPERGSIVHPPHSNIIPWRGGFLSALKSWKAGISASDWGTCILMPLRSLRVTIGRFQFVMYPLPLSLQAVMQGHRR
jgi:hypothetical protein